MRTFNTIRTINKSYLKLFSYAKWIVLLYWDEKFAKRNLIYLRKTR